MLLSGEFCKHAEPNKKLASVVKPKTRRALGIVVGFVGDHLKDKMLTEFNTLDKLLSQRSGSSYPVSNNPSYSTRVCAKCALKLWNVVEPPSGADPYRFPPFSGKRSEISEYKTNK